MLQSVIFDMDGVIVDSEQMHADANAIALVPYGLTMPQPNIICHMQAPRNTA